MIKSKTAKIVTAITVIAAVFAIISGLGQVDNRYAKASDVNQTQTQFVQSIKLINVNLELINLKNRKQSLQMEKRTIAIKLHESSGDIDLKLMLDNINQDLHSVCQRIDTLESSLITE